MPREFPVAGGRDWERARKPWTVEEVEGLEVEAVEMEVVMVVEEV